MPTTSFTKLIRAISKRDFVQANEQFAGIMQQKVADRVQVARQELGGRIFEEEDNEHEKKEKDLLDRLEKMHGEEDDKEDKVHIDVVKGDHPVAKD